MQRRKVIRQGKGTLTMSLPMDWVRQLKLSNGDELEVEQRGFQLIVGPGQISKKNKTEINLVGFSESLVFVIMNNLYIRGDEEIIFYFEKLETYDAIAQGVKQLLGFEIVEQTKNKCVLKELAKSESEDFNTILRRIFLLILTMAEDGLPALKKGDKEGLQLIKKRDDSINTLTSYCLRVLNKKGRIDIQKAMHLYALLILLEQMGDCYSRFYRDVSKISQQTLNLAGDVAKLMRNFYELFYKFDKIKASELKDERDKIRNKMNKLIIIVKEHDDLIALHHLRSISDLIVDIEKFNIAMQL